MALGDESSRRMAEDTKKGIVHRAENALGLLFKRKV
jgi:hypothetical protein